MFGHHDDDDTQAHNNGDEQAMDESVHGAIADAGTTIQPAADEGATPEVAQPEQPEATPPAEPAAPAAWQHPGTPLPDSPQEPIADVISPAGGFPKRPTYQYPQGAPPQDDDLAAQTADDPATRDLIDVKEHALEELEPLLDKLDLPPEEKFRAIMMILQAKDDKDLVKMAYQAAHAIEDEETKARALYAIVNEVDYFTQAPQDTQAA